MLHLIILSVFLISNTNSLNNGLALTPPMGWLHWQRFRCVTDCVAFPDECISEWLIKAMADRMAEDGYLQAGYEYVIIDDCWLAMERDSEGKLQSDPDRFPSGIKALADYIHSKGLKFGIYEDYGNTTCAGYPGSLYNLELDANTFAEWGVDYLKLDGCNVTPDEDMELGHLEMSRYLNQTGRPIVFSCEIPLYMGERTNYTLVAEACNLWRNYGDIEDSWSRLKTVIQFFKDNQDLFSPLAGPGGWNDPDMLLIGNYGLSVEQSKAQMTVWSILAAPLLMSVDLRTIKSEFTDILLNEHAIVINQDPLGIQGGLYKTVNNIDIWKRPVSPQVGEEFSYALGFVSNRVDGYPYRVEFTLESLELNNTAGYLLMDAFSSTDDIIVQSSDILEVRVPPTGGVLWHLIALT